MKYRFFYHIIFTFLTSLFFTHTTIAQSQELGQLYTQKNAFVQQKDYKNALIAGEKMLALAAKEFGTEAATYANYANDMGQLYFMTKQYNKARKLFEQTIKIYKTQLGETHLYYGVALHTLGNTYFEEKQYAKALTPYQTALAIYAAQLSKTHQYYRTLAERLIEVYLANKTYETAASLQLERLELVAQQKDKQHNDYAYESGQLARIYKLQKKYSPAETFYLQSVQIYKTNKHYTNQAATLVNLGWLHYDMQQLSKAQSFLSNALEVYKTQLKDTESADYTQALASWTDLQVRLGQQAKLPSVYAELLPLLQKHQNIPEYATHAYNFGSYYQAKYQYKQAEKWYKTALETLVKANITNETYIKVLNNLAVIYEERSEYAQAEKILQDALKTQEQKFGKNQRDYYSLLIGMGNVYRAASKHQLAEKTFLEAQQLSKKLLGEKSPEYANALNSLGHLHIRMGNYVQAEKDLTQALTVYKAIAGKNNAGYATSLNNLGNLYTATGLYEKAEKAYKQCIKIQGKTIGKRHFDYATTLNQLGLLYFYMGIYSKASPLYHQALKIKKAHYGKMHPHYANTLQNIGLVDLNVGNYSQAEDVVSEALDIYEKTLGKNHMFYANCLQNLASIHRMLGRYQKADNLYEEVMQLKKRLLGGDHPQYAQFEDEVGRFLYEIGKYPKAAEFFQSSLLLWEKRNEKNNPNYFTSLLNLRAAYAAMDKVAVVDKYFKDIIPLAEKSLQKNPQILASILYNRADDYVRKQQYTKAIPLMLKSLRLIEKTLGKNNQSYTNTLAETAYLYNKAQQTKKARQYYLLFANHFLASLQKQYNGMTEKDQYAFQNMTIHHVESFKDFAVKNAANHPALLDKLLEFHTTTKSLLLQHSKKIKHSILQSKDSTSLRLYQQWVANKEYLAKLYQLPKATLQKRNIDLTKLLDKNNELEKQLAKKSKAFSVATDPQKVNWRAIQTRLKADEIAIEVIRAISRKDEEIVYAALLIRASGKPMLIRLKDSRKLETRYLKYYRQAIKFKRKDKYSYIKFWLPFQKVIDSTMRQNPPKRIYFSADGCYNQINLKTLRDPQKNTFLINRYHIQLLNSSKELLNKNRQALNQFSKATQSVLIGRPLYKIPDSQLSTITKSEQIAPARKRGQKTLGSDRSQQQLTQANFSDLPGTEKEITQIDQLMQDAGWSTRQMLGSSAHEKNIKTLFNPSILHIATHGFFIPSVPRKYFGAITHGLSKDYYLPMFRSGIVLTGVSNQKDVFADNEDGILTAYEVTNLRLEKTQLVVLSACETGLGDFRVGEGIFGLQRALKIAGAQNIIMSLWKVDDQATQELMVNFYRNLITTQDLKKAFRTAQQDLKKKYPHPHYWGAFILLGNE